ncbi:MAG: M48 family metallopeptidase [bacterium]
MECKQRPIQAATRSEVYTPGPDPIDPAIRGAPGRGLRAPLLALALVFTSCQNMFTLEDDKRLGAEAYVLLMEQEKLAPPGPTTAMVEGVKARLVAAARIEDPQVANVFDWEVRVIQNDEMVNAFCLPGGKMAVYTGILPVAGDDTGLAVVMGHEIAHAIERHGTEAMTRMYGAELLIQILLEGTAQEWAGLGNSLLQLSYGRDAELEADRKGLRYMARAGYDPRAAVTFWTRMADLGSGAPPEILSTHPSNAHRINQIRSLLPEVIPIYEANRANIP